MKKKQITKVEKLKVKKETIRDLSEKELKETNGGLSYVPTVNADTARCQINQVQY